MKDWRLLTGEEKAQRCREIARNYPAESIEREKILKQAEKYDALCKTK